ncbi:MAG: beta-ketoacyl-ACP reductase [Mycobacterium sp.]|nr:beta-ketoacyl-ACP reductase [Mycobacterium sp.]
MSRFTGNAVAPGYIETAITAATAARVVITAKEHQRLVAARTPLGRVGQPDEVAAVIAFLAAEDASDVSARPWKSPGERAR